MLCIYYSMAECIICRRINQILRGPLFSHHIPSISQDFTCVHFLRKLERKFRKITSYPITTVRQSIFYIYRKQISFINGSEGKETNGVTLK
jgi:hypothetical protein